MRFLIVGFGSIGQRHCGNLKMLGVQDLAVCDLDPSKRDAAAARFGARTFARFDQALLDRPEVVFVTTPPSSHIPIALQAARAGCHLFIEKPLSHTETDVDELIRIVKDKDLITMVGCNMRFHHGPVTIKRLLEAASIGPVITAMLDAGMYLPDWHPELDYRRQYSAQRALGGGVVLDGIHEIDYARWLFGEPTEIFSHGGRLSRLEIDTEDSVNVLMKIRSGISVMLHLDYVQRSYARSCKVIGEEGTIIWDIAAPIRWFSARTKSWQTVPQPEPYTINDMYVEELRYFLTCLDEGRSTMMDLEQAARVTRIALAVKRSMDLGQKVAV